MRLSGLFIHNDSDHSKNIYAPDKQLGAVIGEHIHTKYITFFVNSCVTTLFHTKNLSQ